MSESDNYNVGSGEPAAGQAARPGVGEAAGAASSREYHAQQRFDPRHKSPLVAAFLSIVPGIGQIYIGYYVRGFMIAGLVLTAVMAAGGSRGPVGPVMAMFAMFVWAFNIIDAGRMAALYNHATAGADSIEMPEDFRLPSLGGSVVGGVVLVLFGGIALSNTAFNYRLDWLEDWWPVFPLALGAYLLVRGVMDHLAQNRPTSSSYEFAGGSASGDD